MTGVRRCFTKGTKELVEVAGLPLLWEGDVKNVVSFRLHCGEKHKGELLRLGGGTGRVWGPLTVRPCDVEVGNVDDPHQEEPR